MLRISGMLTKTLGRLDRTTPLTPALAVGSNKEQHRAPEDMLCLLGHFGA
jgi:hypothetical protein